MNDAKNCLTSRQKIFIKFIVDKKIVVYLQSVFAEIAQLVEHDLAKVGVAGSSPVFRSKPSKEGFFDTKSSFFI